MRYFSTACAVLLLWAFCGHRLEAQPKTISRYITFRDGSVMRFDVVNTPTDVKLIRKNGITKTTKLPLSKIRSLKLTTDKSFAEKARLLALVKQLGSEIFDDRQHAHAELVKLGEKSRFDLQLCFDMTTDTEIRSRLRLILSRWPAVEEANKRTKAVFDLFELEDEDEATWGHLHGRIPIVVDQKTHFVDREDILRFEATPPAAVRAAAAARKIAVFRRIEADAFPAGCTEIDFERSPDGIKLKAGTNVDELFVRQGIRLATSFEKSHVAINDFSVRGKSRGMSIATHEPRWQGEITIRFVDPAGEIPAGVTRFGCWIAAVVPEGTFLVGYDVYGREIGRIATMRSGSEFLAVESPIPMHTIRIIPDVVHDRDYTLDDFIFDPPLPLLSGDNKKFAVRLDSGESLLCSDVVVSKGKLQLRGIPASLPDTTIELARLRQIGFPSQGRPVPSRIGVFAELHDGSLLFGKHPRANRGRPVFDRLPDLLQKPKKLASIWCSAKLLKTDLPPSRQTVVWNEESNKWEPAADIKFLEEVIVWKEDGEFRAAAYHKMPPIRFAQPEMKQPSLQWRVRTADGDDLVLSGTDSLAGKLSDHLSFIWQDQKLRLSTSKLRSIYRHSSD